MKLANNSLPKSLSLALIIPALVLGISSILTGIYLWQLSIHHYLITNNVFTILTSHGVSIINYVIPILMITGITLTVTSIFVSIGYIGNSKSKIIKYSRKFSLTILISILSSLFLTSGIFIPIANATIATNQSSVISQYTCSATAYSTYTITTDGTNYYSLNANTCQVSYGSSQNIGGATGTNASAVIQATINNLGGVCGTVFFSASEFVITHGFKTYPCITLTGASGSGDFLLNNPGTTLFYATETTQPVITVEVNPSFTSQIVFPVLQHFTITGSGTASTQDGILITDSKGNILDVNIFDVRLYALNGNCINVQSNAKEWFDSLYLEDCLGNGLLSVDGYVFLTNSYIFGNTLFGVQWSTPAQILNLNHDWIFDNKETGVACIHPQGACEIEDDVFTDNGGTSYAQIRFETSSLGTANPVIIEGNSITDTRTSGHAFAGVYISASQATGNIVGNYFWSAQPDPCVTMTAGAFNPTGGAFTGVVVQDNTGCPSGKIATNFLTGGTSSVTKHYFSPFANNGTIPIASQTYTIANVYQYIQCSGGTGVSITIADLAGNTIQSALTCLTLPLVSLAPGYSINFGAFAVAPTVLDYIVSY